MIKKSFEKIKEGKEKEKEEKKLNSLNTSWVSRTQQIICNLTI